MWDSNPQMPAQEGSFPLQPNDMQLSVAMNKFMILLFGKHEFNLPKILDLFVDKNFVGDDYIPKRVCDLKDFGNNFYVANLTKCIESQIHMDSFTIEELGRKLNLAPMQLYRRTWKYLGLPPVKFLRAMRMVRALQYLVNTNYSISEIAYSSGYADPNYFTRTFTKQLGLSPTKFKEKLRMLAK